MNKAEKIADIMSDILDDDKLSVRNIVANSPILCLFILEVTKSTKFQQDGEYLVKSVYPNWPDVTLK